MDVKKLVVILALFGGSACLPTRAAAVSEAQVSVVRMFQNDPPPQGFDPLSATTAQLRAYGFPPRPVDAGALQVWTYAMQHRGQYVAPEFDLQVGAPATDSFEGGSNDHWAGYGILSSLTGGQPYNYVEAEFTVPPAPTNNVGLYRGWPWVGVGEAHILQAGTMSNSPAYTVSYGWPQYGLWQEDWPEDRPATSTSIIPRPGDLMYVTVDYSYSPTSVTYYWSDLTQNTYTHWTHSNLAYTGSRNDANFILEENPGYYYNFGQQSFNDAYASDVLNNGRYLTSTNSTSYVISNAASVSGVSSTSGFTVSSLVR